MRTLNTHRDRSNQRKNFKRLLADDGHRGQGSRPYAKIQPQLQQCFPRSARLFEHVRMGRDGSAIRNLVQKKFELHVRRVSRTNGSTFPKMRQAAEALQVEWGPPIRRNRLTQNLPRQSSADVDPQRDFDGTMCRSRKSPRSEKISRRHVHLDAVSSMAPCRDFDELGIDVLLAGTQKAFAAAPGCISFCSPAALAKAARQKIAVLF